MLTFAADFKTSIIMVYKGYTIKPYVIIRNGYKYSITEPDGFTHVCSAKTLKEAKMLVNYDINNKELMVLVQKKEK